MRLPKPVALALDWVDVTILYHRVYGFCNWLYEHWYDEGDEPSDEQLDRPDI